MLMLVVLCLEWFIITAFTIIS